MKIIPWRRNATTISPEFGTESFWTHFWDNDNNELLNRLPDVFRTQPFPAVNIAETEEHFSVTMDCPGLEEDDFEIQVMGEQLIISGERRWDEEKKEKEFRRVESQFGRFERTVQLPLNARVEPDKIDAHYEKGVLTVTVPKLEKTPVAKIPVHAN